MIDQHNIPCDFVVLDIGEDSTIPIILERPFLATAEVIIDGQKGTFIMDLPEDKVEFNISGEVEKRSSCLEECTMVYTMSNSIWRKLKDEA